ncbi:MAG TPA: ANTAR domain-containing protein [Solimonas sp.]|nr:ANTAR domain-containing protein [Solimonas sp.]
MSEHTKLRVMLVDDDTERLALLERALAAEGHQIIARINTHADLSLAVAVHKPEVVFIDVDAPGREILESLDEMYRVHPRPIVMCAAQSDAQTTRRALDAGVGAYVVDGLQQRKNLSALLDLAIARFEMQQTLREELDRARTRLADLRDIEKAKGLMMKRRGLDEAAAYNLLRRMAMDRKQRIGDFARALLSAADVWSDLGG